MRNLAELLAALGRSSFRSGFALGPDDIAYIRSRGMKRVAAHAREFVSTRLAPAHPANDGRQTPMKGHPPHLLRLRDGALLCTYGYRHEPYGIRATISYDGARTWQPEFVLRDDGGSGDLGYPVSVELPDGRLLAVYYFNHNSPDGQTQDVFIGGTIYRRVE